jgi:hypothetical protein
VVVREAAGRFVPLLAGLSDTVVFADCGRVTGDLPTAVVQAAVTVVVVRQAGSAAGTVSRIDKASVLVDRIRDLGGMVQVLVIGDSPYRPVEIAAHLGVGLLGVLPEDPTGASTVTGVSPRSGLMRAAGPIAATLISQVDEPDIVRVAS